MTMLRPNLTLFRRALQPLKEQNVISKSCYSTKNRHPKSAARLTLVSASVGMLVGAGYGGYTHYKVNVKKVKPNEIDDYAFFSKPPEYKPQYVVNGSSSSDLHLVLFQYRTCPFCCKVRAYLDARGISYEIVEVDAVLRQAIKWSGYKKVPIVLAKVEGGYQQLLDSTAIISILETYLQDKSNQIQDIIKFYPVQKYTNDDGKDASEISNRYFIMHNAPLGTEQERSSENEERKWRKWADSNLVHMLSPNVYRTPGEALETFQWFCEVGGWKESFPAWEVALMVYGGAAAMYLISKRLKARHHLDDDVRKNLYDSANKWMSAVKSKGTRFLGGNQPNLADISVFGVLSSIEGCQAFQDLRANTDIGKWFDDIKDHIEKQKGHVVAVSKQA